MSSKILVSTRTVVSASTLPLLSPPLPAGAFEAGAEGAAGAAGAGEAVAASLAFL